ncbi:hypothetical protein SAMN05216298_1740 [Glycomyces sambucus]|uniref:Secreted protein n=1 Tax=Glycomyces sambucus TaxID=380244 RepID=A0A1G9FEK8_9ACTN|nr:hypothetical protein [Glycomyces sambucus]SDK86818.1 hypothetical protein SAMN05216298_1740 [Glycomyces sambucus]
MEHWRRLVMVAGAAVGLTAATTIAAALALTSDEPAGDAAAGPATHQASTPESGGGEGASDAATAEIQASALPQDDGMCNRTAGPAPEVVVTEVGADVIGNGGQGDTDPLPAAIAATPNGRSWLAWDGTDDRIHLTRLDCDDKPEGDPIALEGIDLQDVIADADGVTVLVTREGACGEGPLCGGSSSPCGTMHLVRFDNAGAQVWQRQVTNLGDGLDGYDDGARFVWWYQHHGRLASDGTNTAAYFGVAITVADGGCVDIHQGDRMQVVDAAGDLADHGDAFAVGCSHSWTTRIAWNADRDEFGTVCATDDQCRIAVPAYTTVAEGTCDGTLFGGDLVTAADGGYWTAWSQGGRARLEHFTDGPSDSTVDTGADTDHPHLVSYGDAHMLLAWASGDNMSAQVYGADSGDAAGDRFDINVPDHAYQAFKPYPDGSAAFPAAGGGGSIRIARVMPLS